jgi:hypothetical protein
VLHRVVTNQTGAVGEVAGLSVQDVALLASAEKDVAT